MNYTLNQLQIFLKVAQTGSITKTAEALNLSQPAISIQLKNFQNQFDIPLTETVGRRIFITDFGREIAHSAEKIIDEIQGINTKTQAYKGLLTGKLRVSVVSTGKYVMPYFLAGFIQKHPEVELEMDVTNKTRVLETIEKNETDFALVSILPNHLKINYLELMENRLQLIGLGNTTTDTLTFGELSTLPFIFREKGSGTRLMSEDFIEQNGITLRKKIELTSNEAVKQAIMAGLGYSILPVIGLKQELQHQRLRIIHLDGLPLYSAWNMIWLKSKSLSPVADAYLNYVKLHKNEIITREFEWYKNISE